MQLLKSIQKWRNQHIAYSRLEPFVYIQLLVSAHNNYCFLVGSSVTSISLEPTWTDKRCVKELKKLNIPHNEMGTYVIDKIIEAFRSQELKRIFIRGIGGLSMGRYDMTFICLISTGEDKISFKPSEDRQMPDDECRQILNLEMEMMPEYMKQNKIAQKLFIK